MFLSLGAESYLSDTGIELDPFDNIQRVAKVMTEEKAASPLMLEVSAEDLDAVYATLDERTAELRAAEEEIAELSAALIALGEERDRDVSTRHAHQDSREIRDEGDKLQVFGQR